MTIVMNILIAAMLVSVGTLIGLKIGEKQIDELFELSKEMNNDWAELCEKHSREWYDIVTRLTEELEQLKEQSQSEERSNS